MSFLSGMFSAWSLRDSYVDWLKSLQGKRAYDLKLTVCQRCGWCCACRPCIPTPDELRAIAKFLQIPIKEAVKKFFVVDARSEGGTKFCFPAKTTQVDICGTYIPWRRTYDKGYCIFYDVNKHLCSIYPVLPKFAKDFNCWIDETEEQVKAASNEVIGSWEHVDWTEFVNDPNGLNNSRDED